MSTAIATKATGASLVEKVLIQGDLKELTPQERMDYYARVCESLGLNPLTKPFDYITLNNRLTLYAKRDCTDQLRSLHHVSVESLETQDRDGVFIVTAKVKNREGRTDVATGAVSIANLKGDALANAMMKAETKAKRRATLSICGLGVLDETEVETVEHRETARVEVRQHESNGQSNHYKALITKVQAEISCRSREELGDEYVPYVEKYTEAHKNLTKEQTEGLQRAVMYAWLKAWIPHLDGESIEPMEEMIKAAPIRQVHTEELLAALLTKKAELLQPT